MNADGRCVTHFNDSRRGRGGGSAVKFGAEQMKLISYFTHKYVSVGMCIYLHRVSGNGRRNSIKHQKNDKDRLQLAKTPNMVNERRL